MAHPATQVVVNVSTVEMTPENGSTELWLGSHLDTAMHIGMRSITVPEEWLEARRKVVPPMQPTVEKGSMLIRDIRLWHRGTPNRSDKPRTMIAMIHKPSWYAYADSLVFPTSAKPFFEHPVLKTEARFTDDPIDHIQSPSAYDYDGSGPNK